MRILYMLIVLICCVFTLHAQTTWTGAINNDWFNDANWTANAPVTGALAVVLASLNDPVVNSVLNIDSTIQNFTTITFNADVSNNGSVVNFGSGTFVNNAVFTNNSGQTVIHTLVHQASDGSNIANCFLI